MTSAATALGLLCLHATRETAMQNEELLEQISRQLDASAEEYCAFWRRLDGDMEAYFRRVDEQRTRFHAELCDILRRDPVMLAKLEALPPWEDRARQLREERAANRKKREEELSARRAARAAAKSA